jgi:hypothetical protein
VDYHLAATVSPVTRPARPADSTERSTSARSNANIDLASLRRRQRAPVALRVAASLVYFELNQALAARNDDELDRALNDSALAVAQVADIYYENEEGRLAEIPYADLRSGLFEGGAKTFRSSSGKTFGALSVRRIDVMHAIQILGKASRGPTGKSDAPGKSRDR